MGGFIGLALLGISGVAVFLMSKWHWKRRGHAIPWLMYGAAVIAGAWLGLWVGTRLEFYFSDHLKCLGLPLPLAMFALEGENWTDFVPSPTVQWLCAGANISTFIALTLGVYTVACLVSRRRLRPQVTSDAKSSSP